MQSWHHRLLVMLADIAGHTTHEFLTRRSLGHAPDVTADKLHGISSVGAEQAVMIVRLRRAAVNDGDKVICDDHAVLAFLSGTLGDECLLYYFHAWVMGVEWWVLGDGGAYRTVL